MSGHTKGPWAARGRYIKQDFTIIGLSEKSGCLIASVQGGDTSGPYFIQNNDECDANARRIVACVNACEGLSNEQLANICLIDGNLANRFKLLLDN